MKMTVWKITDSSNYTTAYHHMELIHELQWGPMVTHTAAGPDLELCTNGAIHAYLHPMLAALLNPLHRLWIAEADIDGGIVPPNWQTDCSKIGVRTLTTIKTVDFPQIMVGDIMKLIDAAGISPEDLNHQNYGFFRYWNKHFRHKQIACNYRAASFMAELIQLCPNILHILNENWPVNQDGVV